MFQALFLFYLALVGALSVSLDGLEEEKAQRKEVANMFMRMLEVEAGLLGEVMNGCSHTDLVNLGRVSKTLNSAIKRSPSFQITQATHSDLAKAVKANDLKTTKEVLGMKPKRIPRSLQVSHKDDLGQELDLVTYAFMHSDSELFEALVEKLGIPDNSQFKEQFECLPTVKHELGKLQALEKHTVKLPFSPERCSWIVNLSSPVLFEYLLKKGYVSRIFRDLEEEDGPSTSSSPASNKRFEKIFVKEIKQAA